MVKQWVQVQAHINKDRLPPGGFLLGSHLTSFIFIYYQGFHWNIREEFRNPVFGDILCTVDFNKGFNQI